MMEFDKSKILTCVTADQAKVGDIGWFGDSVAELRRAIDSFEPTRLELVADDDSCNRFAHCTSLRYALFYPAPYEFLQEQWVKENGLKVGDRVKVIKKWKPHENGLIFPCTPREVGYIDEVTAIADLIIETAGAYVPYFAIEIVKKEPKSEYRPFANAEEFAPYRDEWFSWVGGDEGDACRVTSYGDDGVVIAGEVIDYERFCDEWCFSSDTGKSAGVKV